MIKYPQFKVSCTIERLTACAFAEVCDYHVHDCKGIEEITAKELVKWRSPLSDIMSASRIVSATIIIYLDKPLIKNAKFMTPQQCEPWVEERKRELANK